MLIASRFHEISMISIKILKSIVNLRVFDVDRGRKSDCAGGLRETLVVIANSQIIELVRVVERDATESA